VISRVPASIARNADNKTAVTSQPIEQTRLTDIQTKLVIIRTKILSPTDH
jgi:hypothetical protein